MREKLEHRLPRQEYQQDRCKQPPHHEQNICEHCDQTFNFYLLEECAILQNDREYLFNLLIFNSKHLTVFLDSEPVELLPDLFLVSYDPYECHKWCQQVNQWKAEERHLCDEHIDRIKLEEFLRLWDIIFFLDDHNTDCNLNVRLQDNSDGSVPDQLLFDSWVPIVRLRPRVPSQEENYSLKQLHYFKHKEHNDLVKNNQEESSQKLHKREIIVATSDKSRGYILFDLFIVCTYFEHSSLIPLILEVLEQLPSLFLILLFIRFLLKLCNRITVTSV